VDAVYSFENSISLRKLHGMDNTGITSSRVTDGCDIDLYQRRFMRKISVTGTDEFQQSRSSRLCATANMNRLATFASNEIGETSHSEGAVMNREQVKGAAKEAAGKVQQRAAHLFGSRKQQAKGLARQVEGYIQKTAGDIKNAFKKR
jgi:uncharacterized protein YjbJ (UPF0337 family)